MQASLLRLLVATERPCYLYRLHDEEGNLLYVGIAFFFGQRMRQHERRAPWWRSVSCVELRRYDTRSEAEDAERTAIRTERPEHNVRYAAPYLDR